MQLGFHQAMRGTGCSNSIPCQCTKTPVSAPCRSTAKASQQRATCRSSLRGGNNVVHFKDWFSQLVIPQQAERDSSSSSSSAAGGRTTPANGYSSSSSNSRATMPAKAVPKRDFLEARQVSLYTLFDSDDFKFDIPLYQRPYSWRTKHVWELLQDLLIAYNARSEYFLGAIVTTKIEDGVDAPYQVIDGQQRLTTLFIMLAFLHSWAKEQHNEILEHRVRRMLYLEGDPLDPASGLGRNRLKLREADDAFFRSNMLDAFLPTTYQLSGIAAADLTPGTARAATPPLLSANPATAATASSQQSPQQPESPRGYDRFGLTTLPDPSDVSASFISPASSLPLLSQISPSAQRAAAYFAAALAAKPGMAASRRTEASGSFSSFQDPSGSYDEAAADLRSTMASDADAIRVQVGAPNSMLAESSATALHGSSSPAVALRSTLSFSPSSNPSYASNSMLTGFRERSAPSSSSSSSSNRGGGEVSTSYGNGLAEAAAAQSLHNESWWRMYENAAFMRDQLTGLVDSGLNLQDFMYHSLRNCFLVVMNARDESSSFSIFSTLNGRGMNLSIVDKLKADLLQALPPRDRSRISDSWGQMEAVLGRAAFHKVFDYMRSLAIVSNPAIGNRSILEYFTAKKDDPACVAHVIQVALDYAALLLQLRQARWDAPNTSTSTSLPSSTSNGSSSGSSNGHSTQWHSVPATSAEDQQLLEELQRHSQYVNLFTDEEWLPPTLEFFYQHDNLADRVQWLQHVETLQLFLELEGDAAAKAARWHFVTSTLLARPFDPIACLESLELSLEEKVAFKARLDSKEFANTTDVRTIKHLLWRCEELVTPIAPATLHAMHVDKVAPQHTREGSPWRKTRVASADGKHEAKYWYEVQHMFWHGKLGNLALLPSNAGAAHVSLEDFDTKAEYLISSGAAGAFPAFTGGLVDHSRYGYLKFCFDECRQRHADILDRLCSIYSLDA